MKPKSTKINFSVQTNTYFGNTRKVFSAQYSLLFNLENKKLIKVNIEKAHAHLIHPIFNRVPILLNIL